MKRWLFALLRRFRASVRSLIWPNSDSEGPSTYRFSYVFPLERKYGVWVQPCLCIIESKLSIGVLAPGPQHAVLVLSYAKWTSHRHFNDVAVDNDPWFEKGAKDTCSPEVELSSATDRGWVVVAGDSLDTAQGRNFSRNSSWCYISSRANTKLSELIVSKRDDFSLLGQNLGMHESTGDLNWLSSEVLNFKRLCVLL